MLCRLVVPPAVYENTHCPTFLPTWHCQCFIQERPDLVVVLHLHFPDANEKEVKELPQVGKI